MDAVRCSLLLLTLFSITLCSRHNKEPLTEDKAKEYLVQFGYIPPKNIVDRYEGRTHEISDIIDDLRNAIREFQEFANLPKTGILDIPTRKKMAQPRCGVMDVLAIKRTKGATTKWHKNNITYSVESHTNDITRNELKRALDKAFEVWSSVAELNFLEVPAGIGDIRIRFASLSHGDPWPFDGRDGILAHATFPPTGHLHFDEDENWVFMDTEKIAENDMDILAVAIHEIGHTLGLEHSRDENSIMAPFYHSTVDRHGHYKMPQLNSEDISKIQNLYGARGSASGRIGGKHESTKWPTLEPWTLWTPWSPWPRAGEHDTTRHPSWREGFTTTPQPRSRIGDDDITRRPSTERESLFPTRRPLWEDDGSTTTRPWWREGSDLTTRRPSSRIEDFSPTRRPLWDDDASTTHRPWWREEGDLTTRRPSSRIGDHTPTRRPPWGEEDESTTRRPSWSRGEVTSTRQTWSQGGISTLRPWFGDDELTTRRPWSRGETTTGLPFPSRGGDKATTRSPWTREETTTGLPFPSRGGDRTTTRSPWTRGETTTRRPWSLGGGRSTSQPPRPISEEEDDRIILQPSERKPQ